MIRSLIFILVVIAMALQSHPTTAQPAPRFPVDPNQQPFVAQSGFFRTGDDGHGLIRIEMYGDLACKVCRADWTNVMSKVVALYSPQNVSFVFSPFPLPFHRAGFLASKSGFVIESLKPGTFFNWVMVMFDNQDSFQNPALLNTTDFQMITMFRDLAAKNLGIDPTEFMNRMLAAFPGPDITPGPDEYDMIARAQWKMATAKAVVGTPIYFAEGVRVLCDGWAVSDWVNLIEYLLSLKAQKAQLR